MARRSRALLLAAAALRPAAAADPNCATGILSSSVCCEKKCGECGGSGCGARPGGSAGCCTGAIKDSGKYCAEYDPPCIPGAAPAPPGPAPAAATATVVPKATVHTVAAEYVSFNFDTSTLADSWFHIDDPILGLLAGALSPAHLRVGGTQQDYEVYSIGAAAGSSCDTLPAPMTTYRCKVLSQGMWDGLLDFTSRHNLTLVFGLNDMYGRPTKTKPEKALCGGGCPTRNQSNLDALLRWTAAERPAAPIYGFELGNELNTCLDGAAGAAAQAADFVALAALRDELWPAGPRRPRIIGPDTHSSAEFSSAGREWLGNFAAGAAGVLDAVTFHMYSLGQGPKLDPNNLAASFLSPSALDKSGEGGRTVAGIVAAHAPGAETWAGETAAANNGGQSGITDTFIDGFWYLDQLGALAAGGVSVFQRQTMIGRGGYPLLNVSDTGTAVLPDYWIALLHKRLMGRGVLAASSSEASVRVYAHCSAAGGGGVAFAVLNLNTAAVNVSFAGAAGPREDYVLTAGAPLPGAPNPLQSAHALLNGAALELADGPALPPLRPRAGAGALSMPPTSYGFAVFPQAGAAACA